MSHENRVLEAAYALAEAVRAMEEAPAHSAQIDRMKHPLRPFVTDHEGNPVRIERSTPATGSAPSELDQAVEALQEIHFSTTDALVESIARNALSDLGRSYDPPNTRREAHDGPETTECGAVLGDDDGTYVCVRERGHAGAHDDGQACGWTDETTRYPEVVDDVPTPAKPATPGRVARVVDALYQEFGIEDDWAMWRDAEPHEVVGFVLDADRRLNPSVPSAPTDERCPFVWDQGAHYDGFAHVCRRDKGHAGDHRCSCGVRDPVPSNSQEADCD